MGHFWTKIVVEAHGSRYSIHPGKANVVDDALSRTSMESTAHVEDEKKELVKEVHRLPDRVCDWLTLLVGVFQFILVLNHPW